MLDADEPRARLTRSLRRGVGLLRLLATRGRVGWRLSDLAQQTGLDPGTVHRLLTSLCDERLATRVPGTRRYALGALAFELGLAAAAHFDLGRLASRQLAELATELQGSVFLKLRSGDESVCIARQDPPAGAPALMLDVGGRRPLCGTAGGLAMLLSLPRAEQRRIEAANRAALQGRDPAHWQGLRRMAARSRALGLAVNLGDTVPGISAVGIALAQPGGESVAALALASTQQSWTEAQAVALAARLKAQAIETLLPALRL